MENLIGNHLRCGLGNQLFQLFTLISKAIDTNRDFYVLHDSTDKRPLYELLYFNIKDKIKSGIFNINTNDPLCYHEKKSRIFEDIPNDSTFLIGHYESPYYFNHNKNEIINKLKINEMQAKYKFSFKKTIGIHFRFEDNIMQGHVQRPNYFIKSLNIIKDELKEDFNNYKFIIFTTKGENDDYLTDRYIYYINSELENPIEFIKFKDLYPNVKTEEEFLYLSDCNIIITSLSTFGWFAFYLSNKNQKRLFMPNEHNIDYELFKLDGITVLENDNINGEDLLKI